MVSLTIDSEPSMNQIKEHLIATDAFERAESHYFPRQSNDPSRSFRAYVRNAAIEKQYKERARVLAEAERARLAANKLQAKKGLGTEPGDQKILSLLRELQVDQKTLNTLTLRRAIMENPLSDSNRIREGLQRIPFDKLSAKSFLTDNIFEEMSSSDSNNMNKEYQDEELPIIPLSSEQQSEFDSALQSLTNEYNKGVEERKRGMSSLQEELTMVKNRKLPSLSKLIQLESVADESTNENLPRISRPSSALTRAAESILGSLSAESGFNSELARLEVLRSAKDIDYESMMQWKSNSTTLDLNFKPENEKKTESIDKWLRGEITDLTRYNSSSAIPGDENEYFTKEANMFFLSFPQRPFSIALNDTKTLPESEVTTQAPTSPLKILFEGREFASTCRSSGPVRAYDYRDVPSHVPSSEKIIIQSFDFGEYS